MLEHTSSYFSVSPLCDEGETFPDFYTRLGPCELQEPVWAKMSSALAAGVTKKRKKSDTKPQAQLNKCQNEKRRREQENIYIEELAELISANFADMSSISVKPDKCAILQETVNQIRNIKQRESATQSSDPVQQGEVSSSRPTILTNEIYGPLLLEALEGFLFVVNAEGKVEHVTENVSTYIKYTRDEVLGKSIYNFIHHGDHTRFSSNLRPMSIGWTSEPTNKSRSFSCRLLVKCDDQDESMEEKQQRVSQYEVMHISSTQLRQSSDEETASADSGPCLLCVASRITYRDKVINSSAIEQFTTKLDTSGKIIGVDVSGISVQYSQFLNKNLTDSKLQDLCVPHEVHKLTQHLKDALSAGQATSSIYRLRLGQDKYVQVQTKSKLFKPNPNSSTDTDFVMATHTIIAENDCTGPTDPGGGLSGNNSVGGPLMTSVVNGTRNGGAPASSGSDSSTTSSSNNLLNANSTTYNAFTLDSDSMQFSFQDIFPTTTWESLESTNWPETRPDSRQSVTVTPASTPTPRPPSAPAYSPAATTVAQSPLGPYAHQPSPTVPNNPPTPYSSAYGSYSPMGEQQSSGSGGFVMDGSGGVEQKPDTKVNVLEEASTMMADSARLRNLLTKPPNTSDSGDSENRNKNTILKGLLNQPDDDDKAGDNRGSPRIPGRGSSSSLPGTSELPKTTSSGGMLLQLLNEKSDDDDVEARAGLKKRSELLQELLKDDEDRKPVNQGDTLLQSLGFTSSPSPPSDPGRARKRPSEDKDENPLKRSSDGSQVSSSGSTGSKLCEKNKMLASLLAITPSHHKPIPPVPASVISATPQEKLPRITDPNLNKNRNNNITQQQQQNAMNNRARIAGRPPNSNYLNQMLSPDNNNLQRNPNRQYNQVDSSFAAAATSSTDNNNQQWGEQGSDPLLSIILDQVIDIVPDAVMTNPSDIQTLLEAMSPQANSSSFQQNELSERMAINMIQKSLMQQCEPVLKSPSSPTITSPAYTTNTISQPNQGGFPPPPNYPRMQNVLRTQQARPGAAQYSITNNPQQQQLLLQQQRKQIQAQQENRRRLLERQSQQQLLIPSNAEVQMNSGLQNIDSLLNNTVAPNVSLQRSSSVPESQLSPTYQLNQANQRISGQQQQQQQPYSPHSQLTSPIGAGQPGFQQNSTSGYQQGGARLSPHPPFNQQLSPRQAYPQQTAAQNNNWQQATPKLSVQQQQNPMLNAQLTGNYVPGSNGRGFAVQRAGQQAQPQSRAVGSPGTTAATRHSPFPTEQFPPPASPNSGYNQSQYLRLQRTNSAPTATTQLPGGLGSPRPYTRDHPPPHSYPPIPPNPHHPMMYQQESQYCYDQTSLQLSYNGADRGRAPPHLQAGVSAGGGGPASEYVRQELRAVVGARTGQQTNASRTPAQQLINHNVNAADLEALGLSFEMPTSGASESPKLWGAMGSDMGSMSPPQAATSRNTMEEGGRQGDHKSSLLQKLLSE